MESKMVVTRETEERVECFLAEHGVKKKWRAYRLLKQAILISYVYPDKGVMSICEELSGTESNLTKTGVYASLRRIVERAGLSEDECIGVKEFLALCVNSVHRYYE